MPAENVKNLRFPGAPDPLARGGVILLEFVGKNTAMRGIEKRVEYGR
jgi:hypothetical protein